MGHSGLEGRSTGPIACLSLGTHMEAKLRCNTMETE